MDNENADNTAKKQQVGIPFEKGKSGNPAGRPKGTKNYLTLLEEALKDVEDTKGNKLFKRFIERAFINDKVLIAAMKKFTPDMQHTEISGLEPLKFEVEILNGNKKPKGK